MGRQLHERIAGKTCRNENRKYPNNVQGLRSGRKEVRSRNGTMDNYLEVYGMEFFVLKKLEWLNNHSVFQNV